MEAENFIQLSDAMERVVQGTQAVWAILEGMTWTEDKFEAGLHVAWLYLDEAVEEAQGLLDRALEENRRASVASVRVSA